MAGTVTETRNKIFQNGKWVAETIRWDWTSSAGGAADATTSEEVHGRVNRAVTNPGATAPTDNYDIVINDIDGADIFCSSLMNRDNAVSESQHIAATPYDAQGAMPVYARVDSTLTLAVTNAGDTKQGSIILYIEV